LLRSLAQRRNAVEDLRGGSDQTKFGLAWVNSKKLTQCVSAAAGPKRREALATGARQKKSVSRSLSAETRWRPCEEAFAAAAGPKRREALATGARHRKLYAGFHTFFKCKENHRLGILQAIKKAVVLLIHYVVSLSVLKFYV
jgi:hypothetical protein